MTNRGETLLTQYLAARLRSRARLIPPGELLYRTTVFAPHPDDESLGCGGTILRLTDARVPVQLVVMTDGEASHPAHIMPAALAARRRTELQDAAAALGIAADAVHCLGFRDRALSKDRTRAVERVTDILRTERPEQVLLPYRHDRLGDHVATNWIVRAALASLGLRVRVREYPVWLWDHWPWTRPWQPGLHRRLQAVAAAPRAWWQLVHDFRQFVDVVDLLSRKRAALDCHASQMVRPPGMPDWIILADVADGQWLARFFSGFELLHAPELD